MNEKGKISGWYSWPVIILALCLFWPVGIFLIIKRVSIDKKTAMNTGKVGANGLGIGLLAFGAIGFFACISDPETTGGAVVAFFFMLGGAALMFKAKKLRKEAESIKQYISIIVNGNIRSLDAIASATGKSYDDVHKDVENMINKGYLKSAYINEGTREIVLPNSNNQGMDANHVNAVTNVTTKVVTCPCCGANNTIMGDAGECEYCASPLK